MNLNTILASITTLLMLCSSLGSVLGATLLVSNQLRTRVNVPVYITCNVGSPSELSKAVSLGQRTAIEVPAGNATAVTEWRPKVCYGTFYAKAHLTRDEKPYVLYDDYTKCKDVCFVLATDNGFSRWDEDKKLWVPIFPITWFS